MLLVAALLFAAAAAPGGGPELSGFPEQDVLSYRIHLRADPDGGALSGSCRYEVRAVEPLDELRFHSRRGPGWSLSFHDEGGARIEPVWEGGVVRLPLGREVAAGELVRLHAVFSGEPVDGLYRFDNRYGDPVVFTDHFSSRARGWLPCEDHPSDRALFDTLLEHPADAVSVGTGDWGPRAAPPADACGCPPVAPAEGWSLSGGASASELPTYQLAFAVGPYARAAEEGDARLVPHYVWRKDLPRARRGLRHHAAWMETMERSFGAYPYAKYCVVQVPTRWGGMENAGNTWIMESLFDGRDSGVSTLAHEFAHMWFGNGAGYAEWWDAWLSEGFASYFGPWLDESTGGPPLQRELDRTRRAWLRSAAGRERPVRWRGFEKPDDFFGSSSINTYQKGAWVLHMLRGEVGDEAFFGGIAAYYREHLGGALATADFVAAMERAAGRELGGFFEQWLDRPGCPELEVEWQEDGVRVRQVQEGPPYAFWLRLRWTDADGAVREERLRVEGAEARLPLEPGWRAPVVDPAVELLYRKA